jgi:hypothetical protein
MLEGFLKHLVVVMISTCSNLHQVVEKMQNTLLTQRADTSCRPLEGFQGPPLKNDCLTVLVYTLSRRIPERKPQPAETSNHRHAMHNKICQRTGTHTSAEPKTLQLLLLSFPRRVAPRYIQNSERYGMRRHQGAPCARPSPSPHHKAPKSISPCGSKAYSRLRNWCWSRLAWCRSELGAMRVMEALFFSSLSTRWQIPRIVDCGFDVPEHQCRMRRRQGRSLIGRFRDRHWPLPIWVELDHMRA